jgi:hypothetical protein
LHSRLRTQPFRALASIILVSSAAQAQGPGWSGAYDYSAQVSCPGCPTPCGEGSTFGHAALIPQGEHTGSVVLWMRSTTTNCHPDEVPEVYILKPDPTLPSSMPLNLGRLPTNLYSGTANFFCGGQSWDRDGRLVIAGGRRAPVPAPDEVYRFHPENLGPMSILPGQPYPEVSVLPGTAPFTVDDHTCTGKYYPSVIPTLRDTLYFRTATPVTGGGQLVIGGPKIPDNSGQTLWELFTTSTTKRTMDVTPPSDCTNAMYFLSTPTVEFKFDSYPRAFQLSSGDILVAFDIDTDDSMPPPNTDGTSWVMRPNLTGGTANWVLWPGPALPGHCDINHPEAHDHGSAVLLHTLAHNDRVLLFGGTSDACPGSGDLVSDRVQEFQKGSPSLSGGPVVNGDWIAKHNMARARDKPNAVILPTGQILLVGGGDQSGAPVLQPEIYDPGIDANTPGTTLLGANGNRPHGYHATTLLLADGRIMIAGGEDYSGYASSRYTIEYYSPRYLTNPAFAAPLITSAAGQTYNLNEPQGSSEHFDVVVTLPAGSFDRAVLIRPGAVTHHSDNDQRYIELSLLGDVANGTSHTLTLASPEDVLAPPGWYMLWILASNGSGRVPSKGQFVRFV